MGIYGYLALWCAVFGTMALLGYGWSLAGMTRAQQAVRVRGRVERVREPRHGSSRRGGISVVVSYRDPSTGQDVTVTNDGDRGEAITAAWPGREIGIHYPPGRPHAFRFAGEPDAADRGLGLPNFAVFLVYAGVVTAAAIDRGWPWALIGFGGPAAVFVACHLPRHIRGRNRRRAALASMSAVPGRVVAVLKDVSTDAEGCTSTTITPVVAFTTREGRTVTAHCTSGLPDPADAYGRALTIHHDPADPADFTPDRDAEHRSLRADIAVDIAALAVTAGAAVAGVLML